MSFIYIISFVNQTAQISWVVESLSRHNLNLKLGDIISKITGTSCCQTYGFPIDFERSCPHTSTESNHASGHQYGSDIDKYLKDEIAFNAMYGPFGTKPINMHISPLITREKLGLDNRRTIVGLSWTHGCSVNDGVHQNI